MKNKKSKIFAGFRLFRVRYCKLWLWGCSRFGFYLLVGGWKMENKIILIWITIGILYGGIGWFFANFPFIIFLFLPSLWTYLFFATFANNFFLLIFINIICWSIIWLLIVYVTKIIKKKTNSLLLGIIGGGVLFISLIALMMLLIKLIRGLYLVS